MGDTFFGIQLVFKKWDTVIKINENCVCQSPWKKLPHRVVGRKVPNDLKGSGFSREKTSVQDRTTTA
jgi:hypothetical protein